MDSKKRGTNRATACIGRLTNLEAEDRDLFDKDLPGMSQESEPAATCDAPPTSLVNEVVSVDDSKKRSLDFDDTSGRSEATSSKRRKQHGDEAWDEMFQQVCSS